MTIFTMRWFVAAEICSSFTKLVRHLSHYVDRVINILLVEQHDPNKVVLSTMANIKTIVDHFSNKIEHWSVNNPDKIMSPQQVRAYNY